MNGPAVGKAMGRRSLSAARRYGNYRYRMGGTYITAADRKRTSQEWTRVGAAVLKDLEAADERGFFNGIIVALGCMHLGWGAGPGDARYDEILNAAGKDKVLAYAAELDVESLAHSGLKSLLKRRLRTRSIRDAVKGMHP